VGQPKETLPPSQASSGVSPVGRTSSLVTSLAECAVGGILNSSVQWVWDREGLVSATLTANGVASTPTGLEGGVIQPMGLAEPCWPVSSHPVVVDLAAR
jgi:hypothetical protein